VVIARLSTMFCLAGVTLSLLAGCGSDAPRARKEPPVAREYTAAQKEALATAGNGILEGLRPYHVVPNAQRLVLDEVDALVPEVDVATCLDRAAIAVDVRRRQRQPVPKPVITAAFTVAAVAREAGLQTIPNLVESCNRMFAELANAGYKVPTGRPSG
jgi:hypothetical protein